MSPTDGKHSRRLAPSASGAADKAETQTEAAVSRPPADEGSWRHVLFGPQRLLTAGILLVTLTVATESLIITAIMPVIVHDIGGLALYGLAFSAFFLAGLVSIPVAGWAVDRYGPGTPFAVLIGVFLAGSLAAALAPSMSVLVAARAAQGFGAAAQFTLTQSTIARAYAGPARVKVLSLGSAMWTVPGLFGPALGAGIASAFGWRWAFGAVVAPALAACALTYPSMRKLRPAGGERRPLRLRWPLQVALGAGLVVLGLTSGPTGLIAVALGLPLAVMALRNLLPAGALKAVPGLPAVVLAGFFLNMAFYAASAFVPLLLVRERQVSVTAAGIAVSAGTISWSAAVWLNTQLVDRYSRTVLLRFSAALLGVGAGLFAAAGLGGWPLPLAYAGWMLAGLGMGICFNTSTLNAMQMATRGSEGTALAGRNLMGSLGTATGTGVGGAAVAAASGFSWGLRPALVFVYALSVGSSLVPAALARRSSPN